MPSLNALVTGGAGFIGSRVVEQLVRDGHQVTVFDKRLPDTPMATVNVAGDIEDLTALERAAQGKDAVFHFAGPVLDMYRRDPYASVRLEQNGTLNVLEACRRADVEKMIHASSFYVYGGIPATDTVDETTILDPSRMDLFGACKHASAQLARAYDEKYGLDWTLLRIGSVYGWGACSNAVREFYETGRAGRTIDVWGTGARRNQFTYVDDIALGCVQSLAHPREIFNLVSPEETTSRELAEIFHTRFGFAYQLHPARKEGPSMPRMMSTKAHDRLGWRPRALKDGIERLASLAETPASTPLVKAG